uniref:Uncharacterized protein n=1 Tax=Anguilla anguilla TaxID=7936 RepID=A0A0E9WEA4_ANGAN
MGESQGYPYLNLQKVMADSAGASNHDRLYKTGKILQYIEMKYTIKMRIRYCNPHNVLVIFCVVFRYYSIFLKCITVKYV